MHYKLTDDELDTMKRVTKITITDYEVEGNLVSVDNLMRAIEDLVCEIGHLEEKMEDMERDIEENYEPKRFDPYLEYGISEKDFY